jgi:hypothetical protein
VAKVADNNGATSQTVAPHVCDRWIGEHACMAWLGSILAEVLALVAAPRGPAPPLEGCIVSVIGLPVPARAHHELVVSSGRTQLVGDKLVLSLEHLAVTVRLVGPRYRGELALDAGRCSGGTTYVLSARPLPATIDFTGPRELVMRCDDGPVVLAEKWWVARKLPVLDVGHGIAMSCEFKSPGYHPMRQLLRLAPGENAVDIEMTRLAD